MSLLKKYLTERSDKVDKKTGMGQPHELEVKEEKQESAIDGVFSSFPITFTQHFKNFDIEREQLPLLGLNRIFYVPGVITEGCGEAMLECVQSGKGKWTHLKGRKLKCFGGLPEKGRAPEKLPPWLAVISAALVERGIFPAHLAPNHVLVNQYQPGEGIMPHTDGPLYHDCVVILSLGFPAVMSFRPRLSPDEIGSVPTAIELENRNSANILLRPNSLLCFSNDAYTSYLHGIDTWQPQVHESFLAYVSSLSDVIDKRELGREGEAQDSVDGHNDNYIRTSLTIRHMF